jgi:hypothetical protein
MKLAALALLVFASCSSEAAKLACEPVSPAFVAELTDALTVNGTGALRGAQAVRSADLWYIAADIDAPGLEGNDQVALWATNIDPSSMAPGGSVFSAGTRAAEFSEWPLDSRFSVADAPAKRAMECTRAELR